jgi:hypothetical protein
MDAPGGKEHDHGKPGIVRRVRLEYVEFMAVALQPPTKPVAVPMLENGDRLAAREFLRRYEAVADLKKAELIDGVVYMASPVRLSEHAEPDNLVQWWLKHYSIHSPGTKSGTNATVRLGPDDVAQPDGILRVQPELGGQARIDPRGYLQGPPELVAEVSASSVSLDAGAKWRTYRRAGVLEYLLWRTEDGAVDWWVLEEDDFRPLTPDAAGVLRSRRFPGLWLDLPALLADDGRRLLATLEAGLRDPEHRAFVAELERKLTAPGPTS